MYRQLTLLPDSLAESATILHVQGTLNTERRRQRVLQTYLDGSLSDTKNQRHGDSLTSAVAAARGALLKSEVVQTLHTTLFTVLMEEVGKLVRASEDATKLANIARDMNDVLA